MNNKNNDPSLKDIYEKVVNLEIRLSKLEAEFSLIKKICFIILCAILSTLAINLNHLV